MANLEIEQKDACDLNYTIDGCHNHFNIVAQVVVSVPIKGSVSSNN